MTAISCQNQLPHARTALWLGGFLGSFLIASSTIGIAIQLFSLLEPIAGFLPDPLLVMIAFVALPGVCVGWPLLGIRLLRRAFIQKRSTLMIVGALAMAAFAISACFLTVYILEDPNPLVELLQIPGACIYLSAMLLTCLAAVALVCVVLVLLSRPEQPSNGDALYFDLPLFRFFEDICLASSAVAVSAFILTNVMPKFWELASDFRHPLAPVLGAMVRFTEGPFLPLFIVGLPILLALPLLLYRRHHRVEAFDTPRWFRISRKQFLRLLLAAGAAGILANLWIWYIHQWPRT